MSSHNLIIAQGEPTVDVIQKLRNLKPSYELREKRVYNNLLYTVAAHIVAKYSGMPFTTFVKKRIFEPLNMITSTFFADEAEEMGISFGEGQRRIPPWLANNADAETVAAAGGVISSTIDMVCCAFSKTT